ncbi:MAG: dephospho-CoA kinase [Phycisphaerae bacterium]
MSGPSNIPVIGLVGGVGSGKSTAAAEFARLGCAVIDADRVGHEVLGEREVVEALVGRWGRGVLDGAGQVDRAAVGEIVFNSAEELAFLNSVSHPRIARRIARRIEQLQGEPDVPAVVLDAAVMLEAGWDRQCDVLVFVHAPRELRRRRVQDSRGWSEQRWQQRENSQIALDRKADQCSYHLDNSSNASHLREQVRTLFHRIVNNAD